MALHVRVEQGVYKSKTHTHTHTHLCAYSCLMSDSVPGEVCYFRQLAKNIGAVQDCLCDDVSLGMTLLDMDNWILEEWAATLPTHFNHNDVKMTRQVKRQKHKQQYKGRRPDCYSAFSTR